MRGGARGAAAAGLCVCALGAGLVAGRLVAQGMIVGGSALDRNLMVGSGGFNARTARPMAMQRDIYTVQDGRMKYNEAAAFAQPRYVPVGRMGQVQASSMIYSSRQAPVSGLATATSPNSGAFRGYGSPTSDLFEQTRYSAGSSTTQAYAPARSEPLARGVSYTTGIPTGGVSSAPAPGYSSSEAVRSSVRQRPYGEQVPAQPSPQANPATEQKYRVSGVSYGGAGH